MTVPGSARKNAFFEDGSENANVAPVVFKTEVASSSVGWNNPAYFQNLGDARNALRPEERKDEKDNLKQEYLKRNAEQEYLMQGMVKGSMKDASRIAALCKVGISVRPTGVLAHQGIESGNPTKAQEFKNKTSKEVDLFLCDEVKWEDIGAVVHYNPRVGWTSQSRSGKGPRVSEEKSATDQEWTAKRHYIEHTRLPALKALKLDQRLRFWPKTENDWTTLKKVFMDRAKEFAEEDHEYRFGHYKEHAHLEGPYIRLKARPEMNMVGDHDLFGFTKDNTGQLILDTTLQHVQKELQSSLEFQAQHGGIWNWQPSAVFHQGIKRTIMGAHSPQDGDPLLHFLPNGTVRAAFYIPETEELKSVWDCPGAVKWLQQTYSGKLVKS